MLILCIGCFFYLCVAFAIYKELANVGAFQGHFLYGIALVIAYPIIFPLVLFYYWMNGLLEIVHEEDCDVVLEFSQKKSNIIAFLDYQKNSHFNQRIGEL